MKRVITECDACGKTKEEEELGAFRMPPFRNPYVLDESALLEELAEDEWLTVTVQASHVTPQSLSVCSDACAQDVMKKALQAVKESRGVAIERAKAFVRSENEGFVATYDDLGDGRVRVKQARGTK